VEHTPSLINSDLYILLAKGRYQLVTSNAVYSWADLYANFFKAFQRLDWSRVSGDNVLILGLGLGSIPYMLKTKFNKSLKYTAVELDQDVIQLARKYVLDDLEVPVQIFHADASEFVVQPTQQWDMACVDVFIDDRIPDRIKTTEFLESLRACLTESGLVLYNTLARTKADRDRSQRFLEDVFLPVFPDGGYLDVGGNWILVNKKSFFK